MNPITLLRAGAHVQILRENVEELAALLSFVERVNLTMEEQQSKLWRIAAEAARVRDRADALMREANAERLAMREESEKLEGVKHGA